MLNAPADPEDLDSLLIAHDPRLWEIIRKSERSKLISHEEFWRRVEKRHSGPRPQSKVG